MLLKFSPAISLGIFLGLALRQILFIDHYAVNVLFFDQWDLYIPFFDGESWWRVFAHQHGPHRQGIGFFLTKWLAQMSGWDSRWDAFAVGWSIIGAAGFGVLAAIRCGVKAGPALVAAGLIFFNLRQYEIALSAPNLCVGGFPLLLVLGCACCWFIRCPVIRLPAIGALTFLLIFSGYGIFAGMLLTCMILLETIQGFWSREYSRAGIALGALSTVVLGWVLFFQNYVFMSAGDGFRFPYEKPVEYIYFAGLMLANMYGMTGQGNAAILTGSLILTVLILIFVWHGWRLLTRGVFHEQVSAVIFLLLGYTLIYCASASIGRVMMGLEVASASRYVTLMIPAAFALFLHLSICVWPKIRPLAGVYLLLIAAGTLGFREADCTSVMWLHNGQAQWKAVYLETHDELQANNRSHFQVYPRPGVITDRLHYLEQNRLNLFSDDETNRSGH